MASLTMKTVDSCIIYMCACLKQQIEEAEYFITKAKSFHVKMKIAGLAKSENCKCTFEKLAVFYLLNYHS